MKMSTDKDLNQKVKEDLEHNVKVFMEDGPHLSRKYKTNNIAICKTNKCVLITGLGCMGVGTMWFPNQEGEETSHLPIGKCWNVECNKT